MSWQETDSNQTNTEEKMKEIQIYHDWIERGKKYGYMYHDWIDWKGTAFSAIQFSLYPGAPISRYKKAIFSPISNEYKIFDAHQ